VVKLHNYAVSPLSPQQPPLTFTKGNGGVVWVTILFNQTYCLALWKHESSCDDL